MAPNFRLDRKISLALHRLFGQNKRTSKQVLPVLMYHGLANKLDSSTHPYYEVETLPSVFESHIKYLHENGFKTKTLSNAVEDSALSFDAKNRSVVITFDDAFHDFLDIAFPILKRYGFTATVFIVTDYASGDQQLVPGKSHLLWDECKTLLANGIEFGSHTVTHRRLRYMSPELIMHEVAESKRVIDNKLSIDTKTFSCPFAFPSENHTFVKSLTRALEKSGYTAAVTTRIGLARKSESPFLMRRVPINGYDDPALFAAKIDGAYDWLYGVQYLFRFISRKMLRIPPKPRWATSAS